MKTWFDKLLKSEYTELDLKTWDTSNVTNIVDMFKDINCEPLDS